MLGEKSLEGGENAKKKKNRGKLERHVDNDAVWQFVHRAPGLKIRRRCQQSSDQGACLRVSFSPLHPHFTPSRLHDFTHVVLRHHLFLEFLRGGPFVLHMNGSLASHHDAWYSGSGGSGGSGGSERSRGISLMPAHSEATAVYRSSTCVEMTEVT